MGMDKPQAAQSASAQREIVEAGDENTPCASDDDMGYNSAPACKNAYLLADFKGKFRQVSREFNRYKLIRRDFPAIDLFEGIKDTLF